MHCISSAKTSAARLGASLIASVLLGACSHSDDPRQSRVSSPAPEVRAAETGPARREGEPEKTSTGTVEITTEMQKTLHLSVVPVEVRSAPRELQAFGRVLDPTPLATDARELGSVRAASKATDEEWKRLKALREQGTASVRALEAAEAAAVRDRLLVQTVVDRMDLAWGTAVVRRPDLQDLIDSLTSRRRLLVLVVLPGGENPPTEPQGARLTLPGEEEAVLQADLLGPSPVTDSQLQGRGWLFLTRPQAPAVPLGAALSASLELAGKPDHGVVAPDTAIVRYDARTWMYLQMDPVRFVRVPVVLTRRLTDGWLVAEGLRESDHVVTHGAEVLLSEETKPADVGD